MEEALEETPVAAVELLQGGAVVVLAPRQGE